MIRRVFSAIDDQEHSGRAADAAIEIARATSAKLVFFMANPAMRGRGPAIYVWTRDYIDGYFAQARARARRAGIHDISCLTKNAVDVARAILAEAENADADYIVVGSDCRPGRLGNWKHSITREVAAKAPCPTIIVHSGPQQRNLVARLMAAE
jgi:nucleotide-binding universal stress UspA family protein